MQQPIMGDSSFTSLNEQMLGEYNGVILHKAYRVTQAVNSGAAMANTYRAVFCGDQAGALAFGREEGKEQFTWSEELFDYGNMLGVSAGSIFGIKKLVFNSNDFASMVIPTYAAAH